MASSVHADDYYSWQKSNMMDPNSNPCPDTPYGASKVFIEALGKYYACKHGLEVICIRFGVVNKDDLPHRNSLIKQPVWLSHRDCLN